MTVDCSGFRVDGALPKVVYHWMTHLEVVGFRFPLSGRWATEATPVDVWFVWFVEENSKLSMPFRLKYVEPRGSKQPDWSLKTEGFETPDPSI